MKVRKLPSLSHKLYTTFAISFILPTLLICICVSWIFGNYQFNTIQTQAEANTQLVSSYLYRYIETIDQLMRTPFSHPYLQSKINLDTLSNVQKNKLNAEFETILTGTVSSRKDLNDLIFISNNEIIYFNAENYYQYLPTNEPLSSRNWYTAALQKDGKLAFTPDFDPSREEQQIKTDRFFISRRLKNLRAPEQENIFMINMNTSALNELFSNMNNSIIVFTNDLGEVIYSNTPIASDLTNYLGERRFHHNRNTWVHNSVNLENYPLTVHVLFSATYIARQIYSFIFIIIGCYLFGMIVSYLLFFHNNKWIKAPVIHILTTLKTLKEGNLDARCSELGVQELNDIANSINSMSHQLQERIKNEYELTLAHQNLKFQALQSQIQPHFIINTIYSFITLNQIGETELLNDSFYSFARLLRYVLSREDRTTLGAELDFLENYCSLHHLRFGNRLTYHISCSEEFRSFTLPKLILQPLVENAVVHGIEPSVEPCTLEIRVEEHHNTLYIMIEDTGVGFTSEQLNSPTSIGIKNVETRMRLWDSHVQLFIERIDNLSVQVIRIPLHNDEENLNEYSNH